MAPAPDRVVLVAARARNGVIGRDGTIPWRIPADFAHFKRTTIGHPLVLGRLTFEGIGRPLPGRQSIVVTSDPGWSHDGVLVARSVAEAVTAAAALDPAVVHLGGGSRVYADGLALATHQVLTEVDLAPEGDTHYPPFAEEEWRETAREDRSSGDPAYVVRWLRRR